MTDAEKIAPLRAIMVKHDLKRGDVARILGLTPRPGGSHGTVDGWLSGARNLAALMSKINEWENV